MIVIGSSHLNLGRDRDTKVEAVDSIDCDGVRKEELASIDCDRDTKVEVVDSIDCDGERKELLEDD